MRLEPGMGHRRRRAEHRAVANADIDRRVRCAVQRQVAVEVRRALTNPVVVCVRLKARGRRKNSLSRDRSRPYNFDPMDRRGPGWTVFHLPSTRGREMKRRPPPEVGLPGAVDGDHTTLSR